MKLDILAIGVHPDDVELGCSGTIINEIKNGKKVGVLDLHKENLVPAVLLKQGMRKRQRQR